MHHLLVVSTMWVLSHRNHFHLFPFFFFCCQFYHALCNQICTRISFPRFLIKLWNDLVTVDKGRQQKWKVQPFRLQWIGTSQVLSSSVSLVSLTLVTQGNNNWWPQSFLSGYLECRSLYQNKTLCQLKYSILNMNYPFNINENKKKNSFSLLPS